MKKTIILVWILSISISLFAKDVKELYERCSTCHGDRAEEQAFGKSKIIANLKEDEIIKALNAYKNGTKDEVGLGRIMESQVYSLEEDDIAKLADYITSFKIKEKK